MSDLRCVMCALGYEPPGPDDAIESTNLTPGIYVLSGVSVCERHLGVAYEYAEYHLPRMLAQWRLDQRRIEIARAQNTSGSNLS